MTFGGGVNSVLNLLKADSLQVQLHPQFFFAR